MEEKSRGRQKAQSGVQLPVSADEGRQAPVLGGRAVTPAGQLLCPREQVCKSPVARGRAGSFRQPPTGETTTLSSSCPIHLFSLF